MMAQWLRASAALLEDLGLISNTPMAAHRNPVTPVSGDTMPSSNSEDTYTQSYIQAKYTYT